MLSHLLIILSGISAATFFQCVVTCPTGGSATSTVASAALFPAAAASACNPTAASYVSVSNVYGPNSFTIPSVGFNDPGPVNSVAVNGYANRTAIAPATLAPGGVYAASISWNSSSYHDFQAWIDYNNNGLFETSEEVTPALLVLYICCTSSSYI